MGTEVVYCSTCKERIVGTEFARGEAYQVGDDLVCAACAVGMLDTLPAKNKEAVLAKMFRQTQQRQEGGRKPPSTSRMPAAAPVAPAGTNVGGKPSRTVVAAIIGVAALVGAGAVFLLTRSDRGAVSEEQLSEEVAGKTLREAREFIRTHPSDVVGQKVLCEQAVRATQGTPSAGEARTLLDGVVKRLNELARSDFAQIENSVVAFCSKEDFKRALETLDVARASRPEAGWKTKIDARSQKVLADSKTLYESIKDQAALAQRRGEAREAKGMIDRVAGWGLPDLAEDLKKHVAAQPILLGTKGLIGWWNFEETSGDTAPDASGNGRPGKCSGKWVPGKVGGGVLFEGTTSMRVPYDDSLSIAGDMTIAFWVNPMKNPQPVAILGRVWTDSSGKRLRNFLITLDLESRLIFSQTDGEGKTLVHMTGIKPLVPGTWVHVVAQVEGERVALYLNGALDISAVRRSPAAVGKADLHLATTSGRQPPFFAGTMDELRLYNRALSPDEIKLLATTER